MRVSARLIVTSLGTVGSSFDNELENVHLNPLGRALVIGPEDGRWSSRDGFGLDKATVTASPIQIGDMRLTLGYRA